MSATRLAALAIAAATACTSGGPAGNLDATDTPTTGSPSGGTPEPAEPLNDHGTVDRTGRARVEMSIELDDYYFAPTTIRVDAGATLNLELENEGRFPHTFTIDALDLDVQLGPDTKREITVVDLPREPGRLGFYCRFHRARGMRGALRIAS